MKLIKQLKIYLPLFAIIALAVVFIVKDFLILGFILIAIAILIFGIWRLFIKKKEEEIEHLNSRLKKAERKKKVLQEENDELRNRKLNIAEIKGILDLGLMEINTNFTRAWNKKFNHNDKNVHFIGALQVTVIAKYGIDMKDLKLRYNGETNTLSIANINPRFLSFNDLAYHWKISEIMEYREPLLGKEHWRKSKDLHELKSQIQERLRERTHYEVKNGPEELAWVTEPLKKQIEGTLGLLFGASDRTIEIVDNFDESFVSLEQYTI